MDLVDNYTLEDFSGKFYQIPCLRGESVSWECKFSCPSNALAYLLKNSENSEKNLRLSLFQSSLLCTKDPKITGSYEIKPSPDNSLVKFHGGKLTISEFNQIIKRDEQRENTWQKIENFIHTKEMSEESFAVPELVTEKCISPAPEDVVEKVDKVQNKKEVAASKPIWYFTEFDANGRKKKKNVVVLKSAGSEAVPRKTPLPTLRSIPRTRSRL